MGSLLDFSLRRCSRAAMALSLNAAYVDGLLTPGDRFTVRAFSTDIAVLPPWTARATAFRKDALLDACCDGVVACQRGGTRLFGAFAEGVELLAAEEEAALRGEGGGAPAPAAAAGAAPGPAEGAGATRTLTKIKDGSSLALHARTLAALSLGASGARLPYMKYVELAAPTTLDLVHDRSNIASVGALTRDVAAFHSSRVASAPSAAFRPQGALGGRGPAGAPVSLAEMWQAVGAGQGCPVLRRASAAAGMQTQLEQWVSGVPTKLLIGGDFVAPANGRSFDVVDPRTEQTTCATMQVGPRSAPVCCAVSLRRCPCAGAYALAGAPGCPAPPAACLDTAAPRCAFAPGWADKIEGETIPCDGPYFAYTLREPIGVVGQIIPWNFPALMMAWKISPALAAGNTVVLKPAEQTPLTAMRLGQLALEAGLPPGVLNVVPGFGPTAGAALVAFTGSTEVGRLIMRQAADTVKNVTLELGGKSPLIVWKDVDVDRAVEDAHFGLFFNHGQCCAAGSRLYVHDAIYDAQVGDPFTDVEQGPQVDKEQMEKILGYINSGVEEGAKLVTGGKRHGAKGYYVQPTVFADVKDEMKIAREEIFGPVQSIMRYSSLDDVVKRANDSVYGLAAGVFARDVDVVNHLTRSLRAGTVWTNCYNVFDSAVPFGGYKQSGIGRDKGKAALEHYTQVKSVYQKLETPSPWLFVRTPDGVKVQVVAEGSGPAAAPGDRLLLDYVLRRDNGYFIYSTVEGVSFQPRDLPTGPLAVALGSGELIAGLEEVLTGMRAGGKVRALVPPGLGYEAAPAGLPQMPTFATRRQLDNHRREDLLFEVQLLRVLPQGRM
eukprot:scaffold12.g7910.t1